MESMKDGMSDDLMRTSMDKQLPTRFDMDAVSKQESVL